MSDSEKPNDEMTVFLDPLALFGGEDEHTTNLSVRSLNRDLLRYPQAESGEDGGR